MILRDSVHEFESLSLTLMCVYGLIMICCFLCAYIYTYSVLQTIGTITISIIPPISERDLGPKKKVCLG